MPFHVLRRTRRALPLLLAVLAAAGCDPQVLAVRPGSADEVVRRITADVEQRVRVEVTPVGSEYRIVFTSTLTNRGTRAARFIAAGCRLDVESDTPFMRMESLDLCSGLPRESGLWPGDRQSLAAEVRVAMSVATGTHEFVVRHVFEPRVDFTVRFRIPSEATPD